MKPSVLLSTLLLNSTALTLPAFAQTAPAGNDATAPTAESHEHENVVEEIVVTGSRRRTEDVQKTPLAVTALNADLLERSHVESLIDIGTIAPDLIIEHNVGSTGLADIYLRGFGANTNDPSLQPKIAVFLDGIYQPAPTGTIFDLFDISSMEVAAGPQGTLAGKNAAFGAIYLTSSKPTGDLSGEVQGEYGSYDHFVGRAYLNFPLIEDSAGDTVLAGRASFSEREGGDWVYNIADGKRDMGGDNEKSGRLALAFTPTPEFRWDLNAMLDMNRAPQPGSMTESSTAVGQPGTSSSALQLRPYSCLFGIPTCTALAYGTTDSAFTTRSRIDQTNVSSTMSYRFDPVTVTAISGFVSYWLDENFDLPGTQTAELNAYDDRTTYDGESQEIRFSSNPGGGWDLGGLVDWVGGVYYSNFNYAFSNRLGLFEFTPGVGVPVSLQYERGTMQSLAWYAHTIFNLTDQWKATVGIRQSWDNANDAYSNAGTGPRYASNLPVGFHNISVEAGTSYQFDASRMAYVRFAQGYEAGGYNGFGFVSYAPENNNEYEVGFKSDWQNKRLRFNIDFFINEVSNLQVESAVPISTPPFFLQAYINAGSSTVEGFESQIIAVPTDDITTHLNVGYLHPKYDANKSTACGTPNGLGGVIPGDCSGLPFAYAPRWTINLGGDYILDLPNALGTLDFSLDWAYKSTQYVSDPPYPGSKQEGYGTVNAALKFLDESEKYSVEFFGTNILDRHYKRGWSDPSGLVAWEEPGLPAEWGIRLTGKF